MRLSVKTFKKDKFENESVSKITGAVESGGGASNTARGG